MPAKLDNLRITECPAAFADLAIKHNRLVDILARAIGTGGIKVKVSDLNFVVDGSGVTGNGNSSGNIISVVSTNGTLQNVYNDNTTGTTYPAIGKYVTANGNVDINSTGVTITTSGGKICNIPFSAVTHDMTVRTFQVCNANITYNCDFIASALY